MKFQLVSRRLCGALFCLTLLCALLGGALAEDCFTLNVDVLNMDQLNNNDYVLRNLAAQTQGIRVTITISDSSELAQSVRLTLIQMDTQTLLFDKDYGYQSNVFDSGAIYLPFLDNRTVPYLVTLYVGDRVYAMPFMQLQSRLSYNGACTYGPRLSDLGGLSSDWLMGTMLDLNALRSSGSTSVDVCASNAYVIGQAVIAMQNEAVCVSLNLNGEANAEINSLAVYVVTDCSSLYGDPAMSGYPAYGTDTWIDVGGAQSALLYMPMQVSYDPVGLPGFSYHSGDGAIQTQLAAWQQNRNGGNAAPSNEQPAWQDGGWSGDNWSDDDWSGDDWSGDGVPEAPQEPFVPMTEDEIIAQAQQEGQE